MGALPTPESKVCPPVDFFCEPRPHAASFSLTPRASSKLLRTGAADDQSRRQGNLRRDNPRAFMLALYCRGGGGLLNLAKFHQRGAQ